MEPKISVIIPSRLEGSFLDGAVRSVFAQEGFHLADIQIIVGIDHGQAALFRQRFPDLDMAESTGHSQAAALNAAAKQARGKYLAFLEDDDVWEREFLHTVLPLLDEADFVSSTQLEIDEQGVVRRINDFPTPSGWVLHRNTFDAVGPFDESYRWHLDNDWLGRLGETNIRRIHMVESTAPIDPELIVNIRPWIAHLLDLGRPRPRLVRHQFPVPLIRRLVHSGAGMERIAQVPAFHDESKREFSRLLARFGRIPW